MAEDKTKKGKETGSQQLNYLERLGRSENIQKSASPYSEVQIPKKKNK